VKVIDLPTNGFDPDIIYDSMSEICETLPEVDLSLSVSIDGQPGTHDLLRRARGAFDRAVATLERVQTLKARFPALAVTVQSTICRANVSELVEFAETLRRTAIADFHVFELVRGDIEDPSLLQIDASQLRSTYEDLFDLQCHYLFQENPTMNAMDWWSRITDIGEISDLYSVQYSTFVDKSPWPFPCLAGRVSLVLESDGAVRACELRSTLGNVRDTSYSVLQLTREPKAIRELADIACSKCYCTHVCSLLNSMERSPIRRMHEHPAAGVKAWLNHRSHKKCFFGN
jgi:MoaA/NifB/PqqE/SkfB family radical SAM enzyme